MKKHQIKKPQKTHHPSLQLSPSFSLYPFGESGPWWARPRRRTPLRQARSLHWAPLFFFQRSFTQFQVFFLSLEFKSATELLKAFVSAPLVVFCLGGRFFSPFFACLGDVQNTLFAVLLLLQPIPHPAVNFLLFPCSAFSCLLFGDAVLVLGGLPSSHSLFAPVVCTFPFSFSFLGGPSKSRGRAPPFPKRASGVLPDSVEVLSHSFLDLFADDVLLFCLRVQSLFNPEFILAPTPSLFLGPRRTKRHQSFFFFIVGTAPRQIVLFLCFFLSMF